jgi:hypothetical protein
MSTMVTMMKTMKTARRTTTIRLGPVDELAPIRLIATTATTIADVKTLSCRSLRRHR